MAPISRQTRYVLLQMCIQVWESIDFDGVKGHLIQSKLTNQAPIDRKERLFFQLFQPLHTLSRLAFSLSPQESRCKCGLTLSLLYPSSDDLSPFGKVGGRRGGGGDVLKVKVSRALSTCFPSSWIFYQDLLRHGKEIGISTSSSSSLPVWSSLYLRISPFVVFTGYTLERNAMLLLVLKIQTVWWFQTIFL